MGNKLLLFLKKSFTLLPSSSAGLHTLFLLSVHYLAKTMLRFKPGQDTMGVEMRAREKEGGVKIAAFDAAWLLSPYCGHVSKVWEELGEESEWNSNRYEMLEWEKMRCKMRGNC